MKTANVDDIDNLSINKYWEKVIIKDGCWGWKDKPFKNGCPYLQVGRSGKKYKASRISFFIHNGYLPLVVRHECDDPICTNPKHLIPGTQLDNINDRRIRGRAKNQNTGKKYCIRGHEFDDTNTYFSKNQRSCKKCSAIRMAERRSKR